MICPECKKENSDKAKFCSGCGTKLIQEAKIQPPVTEEALCPGCGRALKPGTRFCSFCGTEIGLKKAAPQIVTEPDHNEKKHHTAAVPIILGIILLAAMLAAAVLFLVPKIKESEQAISVKPPKTSENSKAEEEVEAETEGEEKEISEEELEELSKQIEKAKEAFEQENYVEEEGCRPILESVMKECVELAEEYGAEDDELQEITEDAFSLYIDAVFAQVDLLFHQDVRPELYEQMRSDLNAGLEQADKLTAAELSVKKDELEEKMEELEESYFDRYIARFNTFTDLET